MSMREWMNNNSTLVMVGAAAFLVVALGVTVIQLSGPSASRSQADAFFWDPETGEHFVARRADEPVRTETGQIAPEAHLFSCGECEPGEWAGYLELRTEDYYQAREDDTFAQLSLPERERFLEQNHLVRALDGDRWVPRTTDVGHEVIRESRPTCPAGEESVRCRP